MTETSRQPTDDGPQPRIGFQLACSAQGVPPEQQFIRWARQAFHIAGLTASEIAIRVVDSDEMRTLNREYRDRDSATNVLSFLIDADTSDGLPLLGDIVICRDVVLEEAAEQDKTPEAHWAHMTVHGVLHLGGYDHVHDAEAAQMESLEAEILAKLGYPHPW